PAFYSFKTCFSFSMNGVATTQMNSSLFHCDGVLMLRSDTSASSPLRFERDYSLKVNIAVTQSSHILNIRKRYEYGKEPTYENQVSLSCLASAFNVLPNQPCSGSGQIHHHKGIR